MECKDFYKMNQRNEVSCVNLYPKQSVGEPSTIQENRILRLCKRLGKFTFEEITTIADDIDESVLELTLTHLANEQKVIKRENIYLYNKEKYLKHSILSFYNKNVIDIVIKCYCNSIPSYKTAKIAGIGENQSREIYSIFRSIILRRHKEKLERFYKDNPKTGRYRIFFDKEFCFYVYNNEVFVSENLYNNPEEKELTKIEIQEIKKVYSYLKRFTIHNSNKIDLFKKLSEGIWRRNKEFEELYFDLKNNLLNIA